MIPNDDDKPRFIRKRPRYVNYKKNASVEAEARADEKYKYVKLKQFERNVDNLFIDSLSSLNSSTTDVVNGDSSNTITSKERGGAAVQWAHLLHEKMPIQEAEGVAMARIRKTLGG
jgi:hypothetical protein